MTYDIIYPCDMTADGECPKKCKDCAHCQGHGFIWADEEDEEEE